MFRVKTSTSDFHHKEDELIVTVVRVEACMEPMRAAKCQAYV